MLLLHDNQRVEDSIAKKHADNGQHRDDDLSEPRYSAGAPQDGSRHEVPDENRSVQKNVV